MKIFAALLPFFLIASYARAEVLNPPSLSSVMPKLGPSGQWVYVMGGNFIKGATTVSGQGFAEIDAFVYAEDQLGFELPDTAFGAFKLTVITPLGSVTSNEIYTVGVPTGSPVVLSVSPLLGPVGQWIYVVGTNFVHGGTFVAIAGIVGISAYVYGPDQLGFELPEGAADDSVVTVTTANGEAISDDVFLVGIPEREPIIKRLHEYIGYDWIYIDGENFVNGESTVILDGRRVSVYVYGPSNGGFEAVDEWYTASEISLETPNGVTSFGLEALARFQIQCEPGESYILQESTDVQTWKDTGDSFETQESALKFLAEKNDRSRFFRLRRVDL
jgi:hypothetical protein